MSDKNVPRHTVFLQARGTFAHVAELIETLGHRRGRDFLLFDGPTQLVILLEPQFRFIDYQIQEVLKNECPIGVLYRVFIRSCEVPRDVYEAAFSLGGADALLKLL